MINLYAVQIRDGKNTLIKDNWIPDTSSRSTTTAIGDNLASTLIEPLAFSWKDDLLRTHFDPSTVSAIKSMHIPNPPIRDCIIWPHSKTGFYSVKRGYETLLMQEQASDNHAVSTATAQPRGATIQDGI